MTKIFSFPFEFFQHELSNSVFGNTMHENLERCKRNLTSYSSSNTTENPPLLLISQELAGDVCAEKRMSCLVTSYLHLRFELLVISESREGEL